MAGLWSPGRVFLFMISGIIACNYWLKTARAEIIRVELPKGIEGRQSTVRCSGCGFHQFAVDDHCADCGQETSYRAPAAIAAPVSFQPCTAETTWLGIDYGGWIAMAAGALLAATAAVTAWLAYPLGFIATLVHELGHSVGGWLFGYPSVPSFDFAYGGGVTLQQQRLWWLVLLVAVMFAWYMFSYRRNRLSLSLLLLGAVLYLLFAFTPAHGGVVLAMGHTAELFFAGYLLYLALGGLKAGSEYIRSAYAFLGFFIIFDNMRFSYLLAFDEAQRNHYETVNAIGFQMDLSRLADYYLNMSVSNVALLFLILCMLTPALSYIGLRKHAALARAARKLRSREPH